MAKLTVTVRSHKYWKSASEVERDWMTHPFWKWGGLFFLSVGALALLFSTIL